MIRIDEMEEPKKKEEKPPKKEEPIEEPKKEEEPPKEIIYEPKASYRCNVCGSLLLGSDCADHALSCPTPKRFRGDRFIRLEEDVVISVTPLVETPETAEPLNLDDAFDVGGESLAPISLDLAVNPFEEDDTPLTPPNEESPSTPMKEEPASNAANPFGTEEAIVMPEAEQKPVLSLNKSLNPFDAISSDDDDENGGNPFDVAPKPASKPGKSSNPFDAMSDEEEDEEDSKNPFMEKPKSSNPFDAVSEEEEEGGNPFDAPSKAQAKPKSSNPFDAVSDEDEEEESGGNPFDAPPKAKNAAPKSSNPFDAVSDEEEDEEDSKNPFDTPSSVPVVVLASTNPFDAPDELVEKEVAVTPLVLQKEPTVNPFAEEEAIAEEEEEEETEEEKARKEAELARQREAELQRQELLRREEEKRRLEQEAAEKARKEQELQQIRAYEQQAIQNILNSESIRVGISCIKFCSNGSWHNTVVKLVEENGAFEIKWSRKKSMFHGITGSLPLQEVSNVEEDGSDPLIVTLLSSKRELKLQFLNEAIKDQFVATVRRYCNLS